MSQETLCGIADLSLSHMSHIENGKTKVSLPLLFQSPLHLLSFYQILSPKVTTRKNACETSQGVV